jgi:hypothetical protein
MSRDPVVIYQAANPQQAYLLQQSLARVGLDAWVESPVDNHLGQSVPSTAPRVVVRRQDAEEARQFAEEFDRLLRLPPAEVEPEEMESTVPGRAASGEVIDAWPQCPECHTPRNAECLACHAAADYFPPAYQHEQEQNGLRMCPTCDDVFRPRYFRHCHRCGHDYGNGFEPKNLPLAEDDRRAWVVLWTMLGGAGLLAAYFSWLFRR